MAQQSLLEPVCSGSREHGMIGRASQGFESCLECLSCCSGPCRRCCDRNPRCKKCCIAFKDWVIDATAGRPDNKPIAENEPKGDILKRSFLSLAVTLLPAVSSVFSAVFLGPFLVFFRTEADHSYLKGWENLVDCVVWMLSCLSTALLVHTLNEFVQGMRGIARDPRNKYLKDVDEILETCLVHSKAGKVNKVLCLFLPGILFVLDKDVRYKRFLLPLTIIAYLSQGLKLLANSQLVLNLVAEKKMKNSLLESEKQAWEVVKRTEDKMAKLEKDKIVLTQHHDKKIAELNEELKLAKGNQEVTDEIKAKLKEKEINLNDALKNIEANLTEERRKRHLEEETARGLTETQKEITRLESELRDTRESNNREEAARRQQSIAQKYKEEKARAAKEREKMRLQGRIDNLQEQLVQETQRFADTARRHGDQLAQHQADNHTLEVNNLILNHQLATMAEELAAFKAEAATLRAELADKNDQLATMAEELAAFKAEAATLRTELATKANLQTRLMDTIGSQDAAVGEIERLRKSALSGDEDSCLRLGEYTVQKFRPVMQKSLCPYARSSKLLGSPLWDHRRSFETNIELCAINLKKLATINMDRPDERDTPEGLVLEIPVSEVGDTVECLGRVVGQVMTILSGLDWSSCSAVRELLRTQTDRRDWRFSFAGCGMFVLSFSPCYPPSSSRYLPEEAKDSCFILFQPDLSFKRRGVAASRLEEINSLFQQGGQPYGKHGNALVKPLDEWKDNPLKWWKIGGQEEDVKGDLTLIDQIDLPPLEDVSRFQDERRVRKLFEDAWAQSKDSFTILGEPKFVYNAELSKDCQAVHLFAACPFDESTCCFAYAFHGTSKAAAEAICRDGFDPMKRHIQTYGPGEYLALNPIDASVYSQRSGTLVFAAVVLSKATATNSRPVSVTDFVYGTNLESSGRRSDRDERPRPAQRPVSVTDFVYGTNLESSGRRSDRDERPRPAHPGFNGPVKQFKVNNPVDRSFSAILPLGIVKINTY